MDGKSGNMFDFLTDPEAVQFWKESFEPVEDVLPETPNVEAIIASQASVKQEEDSPRRIYTGLCSGCIRRNRGLCPCGDMGADLDPKSVNIDLAVRPFDEPNELVSG